jgi:NADP-dependent 3-hydroxy acid dehydrogenase YdfG
MAESDTKVVLITGASSGIGAALAEEFARHGARLVLLARRIARLQSLAREIDPQGSRVAVQACDINVDGDIERGVALALQRFGRIDIVIANAGYGVAGRFEQLTLDDYRAQFETNVFGVLRTAHASLAALKASRGTLVVMSAWQGLRPTA